MWIMGEKTRRLLALLAVVAAGCGGCRDEAAGPAGAEVVAVRDLGPLEQSTAIRGRDGGYSGAFQSKSVWLYGDTILAVEGEDGTSWRHNSWSMTDDLDATDGITGFTESVDALGAPREFFPPTEAERAFNEAHSEAIQGEDCADPCGARWALWPGPLVEDAARGRALILYQKIYGEPGEWNFHGVGMGIATWEGVTEPVVRHEVSPEADHPTLLFHEGERQFGSAAVVSEDFLYLFGCHEGGFEKPCRLARVALADALDRVAWRFYAGDDTWSNAPNDAVDLFDGMDMTTVHWNESLSLWVALYSPGFENRVKLRTAPALTGPWSAAITAFETLAPADDPDHFAYSGLGHVEYARDGGRFEYVSYYRGTEPWHGEIRVVEIELAPRTPRR